MLRIITFKLDDGLIKIVDELAFSLGKTRSEVIREALLHYLEREVPKRQKPIMLMVRR